MSYQDIHASEVAALRAEPELVIFDIRAPSVFERGHMEGAQQADDAALMQFMKKRQRQRPVLVYCYHGESSRDICQFIAGFGFERVYNLEGGWAAWEQFTTQNAPSDASERLATWLRVRGYPESSVHARNDTGMTPLMVAALQGERELVEELLALGADPNHVNDDDHHALWFACVHGNPDLVTLLIAHGANVDNQNVNGATCAIYSASTGKLEVLKCLVEAGADLRKETTGGYTVLDSASTLPVLKYLREVAKVRGSLLAM